MSKRACEVLKYSSFTNLYGPVLFYMALYSPVWSCILLYALLLLYELVWPYIVLYIIVQICMVYGYCMVLHGSI